MRHFQIAAFAFTAAFALANTAHAEGASIGATVGTPGIGIEAGYDLSATFGLRATSGYFSISRSIDVDDITYHGKAKLLSLGLLADLYPFSSGFRLTGGALYNDNHLDVTATPTNAVTIGGTTYTPTQVGRLDGRVDFNRFTPYAGLGFTSNRSGTGLSFVADAGVMFQGTPKVALTGSGPITATPGFAADLAQERQRIRDQIDWLKFYPAVRIGLSYRF